jgi:F0F1-type ATP synthase membrane subunit b/b'
VTEHGAHHPGIGDLLWPAANFILFAGALVYFLRAPAREFFRARSVRLREALEAGARARAEAAALRAEIARDVENLPALRERLRADVRAVAQREQDALLALGRESAQRLREDARLVAAQEVDAARQSLQSEVIDEAVRQAVALVRGALQPADQERLVREFVSAAGTMS